MIKEKTLTIPLTATAYRRFTDLGYDWTNKKEIEVKVEDLPKGSCREITAICDKCGKELIMTYRIYLKRISKLSVNKFNYLMKEVFAKTRRGKEIMSKLSFKSKNDIEYDKFVDKMTKMKKDKGIITDDYIHPDEL